MSINLTQFNNLWSIKSAIAKSSLCGFDYYGKYVYLNIRTHDFMTNKVKETVTGDNSTCTNYLNLDTEWFIDIEINDISLLEVFKDNIGNTITHIFHINSYQFRNNMIHSVYFNTVRLIPEEISPCL